MPVMVRKMFEKRKPYRNKKILKAAQGEVCTANFPGCTGGGEDTVFCHLNESWAGKGMGQKADDCAGFFGCANCHDVYDGRKKAPYGTFGSSYILKAYYKTIRRLFDLGVIE